ncbi:hypothetical protein [Bacillus cereus]|uniref:hypothetical protein n=1 Tax=Bacillus cereus TaxID=1396 RepID=UPI0019D5D134|nr:hypothetical protein [Bacillus cereus]
MYYFMLLCSFVVLLCFMLVAYFYFYPSKGIQRIRYLEEVKQTFANQIKGPKRLIVGGSDVLYSFNTDAMNQELIVPSVNLGTNVGLGMGYLLEFAKEHLKSGDQVIICLAYSLYYKKPYDIFAYEYYRMYDRKKIKRFTIKEQIYFFLGNIKLNISYVQKQFKLGDSGAYVEVSGSELEVRKNKPLQFPEHFEETETVHQLKEFKQYCIENQIDVKLTFPSTLYFEDYMNCTYLQELFEYASMEFDCIGKPENYFVPESQIYNSVYHVNEIGQLIRTRSLVYYLKIQEDKL